MVKRVQHNPRVLKQLREDGYHATSVDYWDSNTRRTKDLFGCIDVIGIGAAGTIAIQVTSRSNISSRRKKVLASDAWPYMRQAGWTVEVWGYDQPGNPGSLWRLKRVNLTDETSPDEQAAADEARLLAERLQIETQRAVQYTKHLSLVEYAEGKTWAEIGRFHHWHPATAKAKVLEARRYVTDYERSEQIKRDMT